MGGFAGEWVLTLTEQAFKTTTGFTIFKLGEDAAIIGTIIFLTLITRDDLRDSYLTKGNLRLGLIIGLTSFLVLLVVSVSTSAMGGLTFGNTRKLLPAFILIWLADGFMEELLFRGLFLKRLERLVGDNWACLVTAIVFTYVHLDVSFGLSPVVFLVTVFLLGLLWGWLIRRTGSLLALVLFHAGVELIIVADALRFFGVEG